MSQSTFLDDALQWTQEECLQHLEMAIPQLITYVETRKCDSDVMQLIFQTFAPLCELQQLENLIFLKLAKKLCSGYDDMFEDITSLVQKQHIQEQVMILLQRATVIVEGLETCLQSVLSKAEVVEFSCVHSLLPTTLHVILTSYEHCKECGSVYGNHLASVSDTLSVFFKKVHSLQMTLLAVIDKIMLSTESSETDLEDMAEAILGLHAICQMSQSLDFKIAITLWRVVSRLAFQHKVLLRDKIDYSPMLIALCGDMTNSYDYIVQLLPRESQGNQGDEKAFSKNLKILGIHMKILIKFVEEFVADLTPECVQKIYTLALHIQRFCPPNITSAGIPKAYTDELGKQLTSGVEPLVVKFASSQSFMEVATATVPCEEEGSQLNRCLLLLTVAEILPTLPVDILSKWLAPEVYPGDKPRFSLMEAIFFVATKCYVELNIPVIFPSVSIHGKPPSDVSLYELLCAKLCTLAAHFPVQHFCEVEECLLKYVLQPNTHAALLAIDVWCDIVRCGSAELCKGHCFFLAHLLASEGLTSTPQCCHLVMLLRRLLKFLAAEHQEEFINMFPVQDFVTLWSIVPLHAFNTATCQILVDRIISTTTACMRGWASNTLSRTGRETLRVVGCLRCLVNLLSSPHTTGKHLTPSHTSSALQRSMELLETITVESMSRYAVLEKCVSCLMEVAAYLVDHMENKHVLKVLNFVHSILKDSSGKSYNSTKLSALIFLQNLGKKRLAPSNEQAQILHTVPKVFTSLLSDQNMIVKHKAIQTFAQFAEETPHESIVPESLNADSKIQEEVVAYLNQVSGNVPPEETDIKELETQKKELEQFCSLSPETLYSPTVWPEETSLEPQSKRMKLDHEDLNEEGLKNCIDRIKENVLQIDNHVTTKSGSLPQWAKFELKNCCDLLNKLL